MPTLIRHRRPYQGWQFQKQPSRHFPTTLKIIIPLIVLAIGIRLYLPTWVKNYTNQILNQIPGYRGHIENVHLHLWRGAYSIDELTLSKIERHIPVPFIDIPKIDFSIHWKALLHGQLVGKIKVIKPKVNFVSDEKVGNKESENAPGWKQSVKDLFPLRISQFTVENGEIHFLNYQAIPKIDLHINAIQAQATNLTNSTKLVKTLKAQLDIEAIAMNDGKIKARIEIDPFALKPTFESQFQIEGLSLPNLNSYFKYYAAVEAETGTLGFYFEGAAKKGEFVGYAKPLIENLHLLKVKEGATVGETIKALVVKFVSYYLKNYKKDRLATRIPITGTIENPDEHLGSAIINFLKNWLLKAIPPGFEGKAHLKNVKKKK